MSIDITSLKTSGILSTFKKKLLIRFYGLLQYCYIEQTCLQVYDKSEMCEQSFRTDCILQVSSEREVLISGFKNAPEKYTQW